MQISPQKFSIRWLECLIKMQNVASLKPNTRSIVIQDRKI